MAQTRNAPPLHHTTKPYREPETTIGLSPKMAIHLDAVESRCCGTAGVEAQGREGLPAVLRGTAGVVPR